MKPSWRKPVGILAMLAGLAVYAIVVVTLIDRMRLPMGLQLLSYAVAGTMWILPLGPLLRWMETGRFR